ncbi:UTRA domain-containing protein [Mycobacterium hodleri]|uniref:UTRA domain-containing protein n=1 Tax=Mycolicibacterium hodleri TaxID=49897 RepID=A0A502EEF9_9MYCO|nr:UTRA domain-containing protein [Mycolicibacterium hodleri]
MFTPFHIGSFPEEVSRLGRHPAARLLWAEHQEPTPSVRLETTFLPADLTAGILDLADEGSLWATMRDRYGIELSRSTAVLESIVLDDSSSAQLNVRPGSAGTLLTRTTFDAGDRRVEFARDVYRSDRASFEVSVDLSS